MHYICNLLSPDFNLLSISAFGELSLDRVSYTMYITWSCYINYYVNLSRLVYFLWWNLLSCNNVTLFISLLCWNEACFCCPVDDAKNCSLTTMSRKLLLYTLDRNSPNAGRFLHSKLSSKFVAESLKIQTHLRGSDACQHYLVKYYLTPFRLAVASDMNLLRHPVFICRNHVNRCILPSLNALFERRH